MESRKMILMNLFTGQQWRSRHKEQTNGQGKERVRWMERGAWNTTAYKRDSQRKSAVWLRELKLGLHNKLEGWGKVGGGREFKSEGTYVHLWLIHMDVWQKSNQYCKPIINHLKYYKKNDGKNFSNWAILQKQGRKNVVKRKKMTVF